MGTCNPTSPGYTKQFRLDIPVFLYNGHLYLRLASALPPKFLPLYLTHVPRQRSLSPYFSTLYSGSPYIKPLYPTTSILYTFIFN
jgi:hypothetical protein